MKVNKMTEGGSADDLHYMSLALKEAVKGIGRTSPNPNVGCVIVLDGELVGRGYHKKAGTPHAEIHALADAKEQAKGATAYVTLEPCSHTGRTGPCCIALADAGVSRVVIGMMDPNPLVDGGGAQYLLDHGIDVCGKVLEEDCRAINHAFIKKITTGLPLIIMKAGVSLDGRLNYQCGSTGWITGSESSQYVHQLRDQVDAIMVGHGTIDIDNPSLTTRLESGTGKNPQPILLDSKLKTSLASKVYNREDGLRPIVVCQEGLSQDRKRPFEEKADLIEVPYCDSGLDLKVMVEELGRRDINSVLVEGGAQVHGALLRAQLYDYAYLFHAPVFAGDAGVPLAMGLDIEGRDSAMRITSPQYLQLGNDMLVKGFVQYP